MMYYYKYSELRLRIRISTDRSIQFWSEGKIFSTSHNVQATSIDYNNDTHQLLTIDHEGTAWIWDTENIPNPDDIINNRLSPDYHFVKEWSKRKLGAQNLICAKFIDGEIVTSSSSGTVVLLNTGVEFKQYLHHFPSSS